VEAFIESAGRKGSAVVVGLDPHPGLLPPALAGRVGAGALSEADALGELCFGVLEAVAGEVAAVKLQSGYFERLGPEGAGLYARLIGASTDLGLPTIADAKRGDIGPVAAAYAEAHLVRYGATAVTVNPYMGEDAVRPFLEEARLLGGGGGAFVLVATSNPSAQDLQGSGDPPLWERVARMVRELGRPGTSGYGDVGAVVGATRPEVGRAVRELLPRALFLAPGYGAQGGGAAGVGAMLDDRGSGVLVNSSRGILGAHLRAGDASDYRGAARAAARRMREDLKAAGLRF